ncbi:MAG: DUF433 domain-containing protein [Natrialbaceae archaeon]|nr:DUF433 domain-containing protein [Natrialbaceae archaeon]
MSQPTPRIVQTLHDEPHLEGRRVTVRFLQRQVEDRGLEPRTVADRHDLDVADVYRALTYYQDHPTEMRTVEQQRANRIEDARSRATTRDDISERYGSAFSPTSIVNERSSQSVRTRSGVEWHVPMECSNHRANEWLLELALVAIERLVFHRGHVPRRDV